MGVLVLSVAEEFVFFTELCDEHSGGNGALVDRVVSNVPE
jgi:hypothetical protein